MTEAPSVESAPAEEPDPRNLCLRLSDGTPVKYRTLRQRACDEHTGKKNKICAGHLKRWYGFGQPLVQAFGTDPEIYRCERCQMLYRPNREEIARTLTLAF